MLRLKKNKADGLYKYFKVTMLLLSICMLYLLNMNCVYASDEKQVTIHYSREDKNYKDYKIAIWSDSGSGKDYDFTVEKDEAIVKYVCSSDVSEVSFIIKASNNAKADINANRTIDVSELKNNTVDVYIKSDIKEISTDQETKPDNSKVSENNDQISTTETVDETSSNEIKETTTAQKYDDSDDDISIAYVIIADVAVVVTVAVILYAVLNKKSK